MAQGSMTTISSPSAQAVAVCAPRASQQATVRTRLCACRTTAARNCNARLPNSGVSYTLCVCVCVSTYTGAKVAVCELPFDYKSSETKGGVGGT